MDFNLKQWRDQQHESEEEQQHSAKIPRLLLESPQHHQHQEAAAAAVAVLPLFVSPEPSQSNKIDTHLSAYPDHSSTTTRFPRVGGGYCFSKAQWQDLELQALIFRHMVAGAAVPPNLLQLVKKSLLSSSTSSYYVHNYPAHFQPAALLQGGYWGKGAMDPEPGRCRRTDGKKWRCSRDVVAGHKYCERHVHRGRNRSRKPVEFPASSGGAAGGLSLNKSTAIFAAGPLGGGGGSGGGGGVGGGNGGRTPFSLTSGSGAASLDAFQLSQGSSELRSDKKTLFEPQNESHSGEGKSDSRVLMHFFDDWPRTLQDSDNPGNSSSTCLTISTPGGNRQSSSDFLRLSTGNVDELGGRRVRWGPNPVASMGGPLAEALRSSTNSSPTSVLHQLPRCSASDTSYVTA